MSRKTDLIRQVTGAIEMELVPIPGEGMTLSEIDGQLESLNQKFQMLLTKATDEGADGYTEKFKSIMSQTAALKEKRKTIEELRKENAAVNHYIAGAVEVMKNTSSELTEWDEPTIRQLVDSVTVVSADQITVCLRGGVEIQQNII